MASMHPSPSSTTAPPLSEPEVLPGLTASDCERIRARRVEIEQELAQMGASREFCRDYFMSACGTCEQTRGCACVRHSTCGPALPAHLMDVDDFAVYLSDLDENLAKVRGDIDKYKQRYREVTADGFMNGDTQPVRAFLFLFYAGRCADFLPDSGSSGARRGWSTRYGTRSAC